MTRRILLVEDCRDDAELTAIALADAGLDVRCDCVDNEPALERALRQARPDMVISDLSLPGFSAVRALQLVRTLAPDVPFVVLSGIVPDGHEIFGQPQPPEARGEKDALPALAGVVRELLPPAD